MFNFMLILQILFLSMKIKPIRVKFLSQNKCKDIFYSTIHIHKN